MISLISLYSRGNSCLIPQITRVEKVEGGECTEYSEVKQELVKLSWILRANMFALRYCFHFMPLLYRAFTLLYCYVVKCSIQRYVIHKIPNDFTIQVLLKSDKGVDSRKPNLMCSPTDFYNRCCICFDTLLWIYDS